MFHRHAWHDSSLYVSHLYAWHDLFICVSWLLYMCDMTYLYVRHDLPGFGAALHCCSPLMQPSVTCLIDPRDMTHPYMCRIYMGDMTHSYMCHDSSICVTWLIYTCDMTYQDSVKPYTAIHHLRQLVPQFAESGPMGPMQQDSEVCTDMYICHTHIHIHVHTHLQQWPHAARF